VNEMIGKLVNRLMKLAKYVKLRGYIEMKDSMNERDGEKED
jgi:hypothetical protein